MSAVEIESIVSVPFMENTLVVRRAGDPRCLIVDPGFEPRKILQHIERLHLVPELILLTHGHADHIAGNAALRERWPELPIVIGLNDAPLLTDPQANLSGLGGVDVVSPPADRLVVEGDQVTAAGLVFDVLDIPGHSPGHVVYVLQGVQPGVVLGEMSYLRGASAAATFREETMNCWFGGSGRSCLRRATTRLCTRDTAQPRPSEPSVDTTRSAEEGDEGGGINAPLNRPLAPGEIPLSRPPRSPSGNSHFWESRGQSLQLLRNRHAGNPYRLSVVTDHARIWCKLGAGHTHPLGGKGFPMPRHACVQQPEPSRE